ncbi:Plant self-incompatibility S1 [Macleaya cordata]|uniref:S-protein homolog n=1 Tax=Macleaya cordata TaxID=56857 RepID=A0A200QRQ5_MACCD|nr:Plant self-incompatibility S1 [Macleaya cordata]
MERRLRQLAVVIVAAALTAKLGGISSVSGFKFNPKTHVYVTNSLPKDTNMVIHCKSKDDDLGEHSIPYNQTYTWSFHLNYSRSTLFWCRIGYWDAKAGRVVQGSFKMYEFVRDFGCTLHCFRFVQTDGIYFGKDRKVLKYQWPS